MGLWSRYKAMPPRTRIALGVSCAFASARGMKPACLTSRLGLVSALCEARRMHTPASWRVFYCMPVACIPFVDGVVPASGLAPLPHSGPAFRSLASCLPSPAWPFLNTCPSDPCHSQQICRRHRRDQNDGHDWLYRLRCFGNVPHQRERSFGAASSCDGSVGMGKGVVGR